MDSRPAALHTPGRSVRRRGWQNRRWRRSRWGDSTRAGSVAKQVKPCGLCGRYDDVEARRAQDSGTIAGVRGPMTATAPSLEPRYALAVRLGIRPTLPARLHAVLDAALHEASAHALGPLSVLDAGCGRKSPLAPFRGRIGRLVGVDVHAPDRPLPFLDDFAAVDVCRDGGAFDDASFDLVLSNFTMEHLADPPAAMANLHRWLRPGGVLVVTTVNRRHPFVTAYLALPDVLRRRVQPLVKASAADAHPLAGRCNDPTAIRAALTTAGFEGIELETLGNLGRAWARRRWSFALGLVGDLLARATPSRRSTILAVARRRPTSESALG